MMYCHLKLSPHPAPLQRGRWLLAVTETRSIGWHHWLEGYLEFFFFDHEKALYRCSAISGPYLSHFDELFVIGRHRGPSTLAADTLLGGALVSLAAILPDAIVMRIQVRPRFHHIC